MPARLIDGDAIWTSLKINQVQPESFRAEYANWLPLADSNGVFEIHEKLIWRTIYAFNRPSITPEIVKEMLEEFKRVELIHTFQPEGSTKTYGYFNGIDARLPSPSTRSRYKNNGILPPIKNEENIDNEINNLPCIHEDTGQDHDRIALGLHEDSIRIAGESDHENRGGGSFKNISKIYARYFKLPHSKDKKYKEPYQEFCRKYGEDIVLEQFEVWAQQNSWKDRMGNNGLRQFFSDLDEMVEIALDRKSEKDKHQAELDEAKRLSDLAMIPLQQELEEKHKRWAEEAERQAIIDANPELLFGG